MKKTLLAFIFIFLLFYTNLAFDVPSRRIYGGNPAKPGQFPFQVSLRKNGSHFCGGVILRKKWIVTAAHCLDEIRKYSYLFTVTYGTIYYTGQEKTHAIMKFILHENWGYYDFFNFDIALIKLKCPILFNEFVQPIKIYRGPIKPGEEVTVSGWGNVESGHPPLILQHLNVRMMSYKMCKNLDKRIGKNNICTLDGIGFGSCVGDSGGALIKDGKLLGLTSFFVGDQIEDNNKCGNGQPSGYVRVSKFIDWIKKKMKL